MRDVATASTRKVLSRAAVQRLRRDLTLGQRIKYARTGANLSLDRLAAQVGTSRQHLIRLEKGQHKPRPEMAARIADATGVPAELLAADDDEEADPVEALMVALRRVLSDRKSASWST